MVPETSGGSGSFGVAGTVRPGFPGSVTSGAGSGSLAAGEECVESLCVLTDGAVPG